MSLLLQRNCSIHHESTSCRIVACMYVFLVGFLRWSVTFAFSEVALEETKLISEQHQPSALGSSRHLSRTRPEGMSYIYYIDSCPHAYDLVREHMQLYISQDPSNAAGILRMFFYDCFIQGCDASVLLEWPEVISERPDINSLRQTSFQIINEIKASLEVACPGVVSCADILALGARDAIFMVGGPWIPILTGRKDGVRAVTYQVLSASIPPPTFGFHELKHMFSSIGLSVKDLVALSGAHTIGQAHCGSVVSQLLPTSSGDLNPSFANNLSKICLTHDSLVPKPHLTLHLDGLTPNTFDNAFFKNVLRKEAIFQSDAVLMDDDEALSYVQTFALDQVQFFEQFRLSFVKMSQIGVLTDAKGEVRMSCTIRN